MRVVRDTSQDQPSPSTIDRTDVERPVEPSPAAGFPLVLVTWHDAFFDLDQASPEDCRPDYLVRTVGFLVREGAGFVSVAQEVLPDDEGFRAITHIPRSVIETVVVLRPEATPLEPR